MWFKSKFFVWALIGGFHLQEGVVRSETDSGNEETQRPCGKSLIPLLEVEIEKSSKAANIP